jgi:hypothetical protein
MAPATLPGDAGDVNGYLARLLTRTRSLDQLVWPRPAALFGQPIAGPEARLQEIAPGRVAQFEGEREFVGLSSGQQRPAPGVRAATPVELPANPPESAAELPTRGTPREQMDARPAADPVRQSKRMLRPLEVELPWRVEESTDTPVAEREGVPDRVRESPRATDIRREERSEQTRNPEEPSVGVTHRLRPEATDQEPARRRAAEPRSVQRPLNAVHLEERQPAEPVPVVSHEVSPPAAPRRALLSTRPAPAIEESPERKTPSQPDTILSRIASSTAVRPSYAEAPGTSKPPLATRISRRDSENAKDLATVHVTIGTLEVRANVMPGHLTPRAAKPTAPRLSLEEYLRQRRERGHG